MYVHGNELEEDKSSTPSGFASLSLLLETIVDIQGLNTTLRSMGL